MRPRVGHGRQGRDRIVWDGMRGEGVRWGAWGDRIGRGGERDVVGWIGSDRI